ncbi:MAG: hypothetical protein ACHQ50_10330 [Fimbriimonadales bacterium]
MQDHVYVLEQRDFLKICDARIEAARQRLDVEGGDKWKRIRRSVDSQGQIEVRLPEDLDLSTEEASWLVDHWTEDGPSGPSS